jgi:hypothetical protein
MSNALAHFHKYKEIFINRNIRENSHIPKLHSMEHYITTIKSQGLADEFNTELPEHLHIDFAKVGYCVSSRKDYIIQIFHWIACQEKIHASSAYLQWHIPYMRELDPSTGKADLADKIENGGALKDLEVELEEDIMNPGHTYHIAKYPGYPNTTISTIISEFQATDFIHTLSTFVHQVLPNVHFPISETTCLDLYKQVTFSLRSIQQIEDTMIRDVVRATLYIPQHEYAAACPAHFDTVLVHYTSEAEETGIRGELI